MSGAFGTNWLDLSSTSNRYIQTYYKGFVDISGGPLYVRNNNLNVQGGDVSLNGRLYSAGDVSLNSRLFVGSDASFNNRVFVTGNLSVSGNITGTFPNGSIPSSAIIGGVGSSNFTTDVSINQRLIVLGDTSLNGCLYVKNDSLLAGNVTLTTSGLLTANGGATINGNLAISTSKGISGGSTTAVVADLNIYGLNIGAGAFTAASDCTLNGNLAISTSKGISGGSITAVATALKVYALSVGAGDITTTTGSLGIGVANPDYPLKVVNTTSNVTINNAGRLSTDGATNAASTTTASVSIKASGSIWTDVNVFSTSDKRIKTDINAVNGNNALDKLRQLKPVEYYHIDKFEAGVKKNYGFIAQEVIQIIPESISLHKDYIPNIYDAASVIDNSLIVLDTKTTNEFTLSGDTINIQLYDYKNRSKTVTLDKIINSKSFTIKEPLSEKDLSDNKIFVYGQEVDDFHILSKEIVFTIGTAALLEVDKELEKTKIVVNDISMNMPLYETRLSIAEQKLEEQSILIRQLQEQINQLKQ
jgi:hypothetical protein